MWTAQVTMAHPAVFQLDQALPWFQFLGLGDWVVCCKVNRPARRRLHERSLSFGNGRHAGYEGRLPRTLALTPDVFNAVGINGY